MTGRRLWPVAVALLVVIVHLPYLWPGGPWTRRPGPLILGQDEGTVLYDAHRVETGQVMYRDFFEFQGPVFYYAHAALFAAAGGPSLTVARAFGLLVAAAGSALLAVLVARFAGRAAGAGAALIHAFVLVPMWPFDYPHWLAETLALAGLVLVVREDPPPRAQLGAGAFLALSLFTIQSVGLPVLAAVLAASALPGLASRDVRRALVAPARIVAGAAAVAVPILAYFGAHGALDDLAYAMFVWPMKHYPLGQGGATSYGWGMDSSLREHQQSFRGPWLALASFCLHLIYVLPALAVVAAVAGAAVAIHRLVRRRGDGFPAVTAAAAALAAVSPLWLAPVRPDIVHVACLGSFGLVGGAALLGLLLARAGRAARARVAAAFCLVAAAGGVSYAYKTAATWPASRALGDWREESLKLNDAKRLDGETRPGDTIVVGAMGGFYYLYVRPSAVPNTYIPATLPAYLSDAQWQRIADDVAANKPRALLLIGKQWAEILKRRPELDGLYRRSGGLLLRAD